MISEIEMPEFEMNGTEIFGIDFEDFAATEIDIQQAFETRYCKPPRSKDHDDNHCRYNNALKLAQEIEIEKGSRHFVEVSGNFIFGDFIESLFHAKKWDANRVVISSLSVSKNNVDSLANLLNWGWVDELDIITSDYFYSHNREMVVPYMYEMLDNDNKFQLAAARTHEKTVCIQTKCGLFVVIHGSANLVSSGNLEQFQVEENEILYNFLIESQNRILAEFATINKNVDPREAKALNRNKTWVAAQMEVQKKQK